MAGAVEYTDCTSAEGYDSPNECPVYDAKQSDGDFGEYRVTLQNKSLPGPLWPGMVASDSVLSMGQIELNSVLILN